MTLIAIFMTANLLAQSSQKEIIVRPDETLYEAFKMDRYQFKNFEQGYLMTPKGKRTQLFKLNFDNLNSVPVIIDTKGDTLVANHKLIKSVHIKGKMFVKYDKDKYFQMLVANAPVQLGITRKWNVARIEARFTDPASGKEQVSLSRDSRNTYYSKKLATNVRNEFKVYQLDTAYVFISKTGELEKARKAALNRMLPTQKARIDAYVKEHAVDFKDWQQVKQLLLYLAENK